MPMANFSSSIGSLGSARHPQPAMTASLNAGRRTLSGIRCRRPEKSSGSRALESAQRKKIAHRYQFAPSPWSTTYDAGNRCEGNDVRPGIVFLLLIQAALVLRVVLCRVSGPRYKGAHVR
jgi:hypothetical protein